MFLDNYYPDGDNSDLLDFPTEYADGYQDYLVQLGYRIFQGKPWRLSSARTEEVSNHFLKAMRYQGNPLQSFVTLYQLRVALPESLQTSPSLVAYADTLSLKIACELTDIEAIVAACNRFITLIPSHYETMKKELQQLSLKLIENAAKQTQGLAANRSILAIRRTYDLSELQPEVAGMHAIFLTHYLNKIDRFCDEYRSNLSWWCKALKLH